LRDPYNCSGERVAAEKQIGVRSEEGEGRGRARRERGAISERVSGLSERDARQGLWEGAKDTEKSEI
jgi:hypothetical protein